MMSEQQDATPFLRALMSAVLLQRAEEDAFKQAQRRATRPRLRYHDFVRELRPGTVYTQNGVEFKVTRVTERQFDALETQSGEVGVHMIPAFADGVQNGTLKLVHF